MDATLHAYVDTMLAAGRIAAEDVRRLATEILPNGPSCREEADLLVGLDRAVAMQDPSWPDYLVSTVVDFVVWTARPTGYVDGPTATWLTGSLAGGGEPTLAAARIAFEAVTEAQRADERLLAFALRYSTAALRSRAPRTDAAAAHA